MLKKGFDQIQILQEGGARLAKIKKALLKEVVVGKTGQEIDQVAEALIRAEEGEPSFKTVKDYRWACCINLNEGVVHGIPTNRPIKDGDVVSVDVGFFYKGFHTDTSFTVQVGKKNQEVTRFLQIGKEALVESIKRAVPQAVISDISKTIQRIVEGSGYRSVRALTGHGIGKSLHEDPQIPCFWESAADDEVIPEGAVLAIEVIYTMGSPELVLEEDNWTIRTRDGKIAGLFEETVAVTKGGPLVLTAPFM